MGEVEKGASLPGLYPPNAENKARYEAEPREAVNRWRPARATAPSERRTHASRTGEENTMTITCKSLD